MSRQNFNTGQEIVSQDFNDLQSRLERGIYDQILYEMMGRKNDGFFQDGFFCTFLTSSSVVLKAGLGFVDENTGTAEPLRKPVVLDTDETIIIDTPDSSFDRIDIIAVKSDRVDGETANRKFKDEFTDVITTETFVISTDWAADIEYVAGTPGASPSAPSVPSGYIKIAEFLVSQSTGIANQAAITDSRSKLPISVATGGTGSALYDAIVGTVGVDQGANFSDLKAALDNASDGWRILIIRDQSLSSIPVVNNDDVEIEFKRGVSIIKDSTNTGLQISGNDCKITNGRFQGFSVGSDVAIEIDSGVLRTYLEAPRFSNCDTTINDAGTDSLITAIYEE